MRKSVQLRNRRCRVSISGRFLFLVFSSRHKAQARSHTAILLAGVRGMNLHMQCNIPISMPEPITDGHCYIPVEPWQRTPSILPPATGNRFSGTGKHTNHLSTDSSLQARLVRPSINFLLPACHGMAIVIYHLSVGTLWRMPRPSRPLAPSCLCPRPGSGLKTDTITSLRSQYNDIHSR